MRRQAGTIQSPLSLILLGSRAHEQLVLPSQSLETPIVVIVAENPLRLVGACQSLHPTGAESVPFFHLL